MLSLHDMKKDYPLQSTTQNWNELQLNAASLFVDTTVISNFGKQILE